MMSSRLTMKGASVPREHTEYQDPQNILLSMETRIWYGTSYSLNEEQKMMR